MKVISTNIASPKTLFDGKKEITTGIFKTPVDSGIYLGTTDVKDDNVLDRKHHGGEDKACYLYSADWYPFWKEQYPELDWHWGMFGENITVEGLDEAKIQIGDQFAIGEAVIEVSEPRRPCNVLGLRFEDKNIIKKFTESPYPGIYVRVLQEGIVNPGDELKILNETCGGLKVKDIYSIFSSKRRNITLMHAAINEPKLSEDCKKSIRKRMK